MRALLVAMRQRTAQAHTHGKRPRLAGQAGMTLIEIMLVLVILATVMGVLFGPALLNMFSGSQVKTTKILVDKYAHQGFVQWRMNNDDACPGSITELSKYLGRENAKDSYGNELIMLCGDNLPEGAAVSGIGIVSPGKDKKQDTKDDIVSWKKAPKDK